MKRMIIDLIKKNKFLFSISKKTYRFFTNKQGSCLGHINNGGSINFYYLTYFLNSEKDLGKIKQHYDKIEITNKKLLIIISDNKMDISLHRLFENNPDISFLSTEFMLKYYHGIVPNNIILLDFNNLDKRQNKLFEVIGWRF